MNRNEFQKAAKLFRAGRLTLDEFTAQTLVDPAKQERPAGAADYCLDLDRKNRCGHPEVIFGPGKSTTTICKIVDDLIVNKQNVLATRLDEQQAATLREKYREGIFNDYGKTFRIQIDSTVETKGRVAVVSAGTADLPVAHEAIETLQWMNVDCVLVADVGVAGPQRLPNHLHRFQNCNALVVVAGMEAALPSVIGGYVDCPVISVPTSVGYGWNMQGVTAMLSMLNSCAANVTVVNIDAGFKAAFVAGLIARK